MASERKRTRRTLFVGLVCLDIISVCEKYPEEDQDMPALSQRWQRGGNASNQAYVFSQLSSKSVEFFGSVTSDFAAEFALDTLRKNGIICSNCSVYSEYSFPKTCAICSRETGSRTMVHFRGQLPEVGVEDFTKLDLTKYDFIQFETRRKIEDTKAMAELVRAHNASEASNKITISIEIEKTNSELRSLLPLADFVFISKDFAGLFGCKSAASALTELQPELREGATLICPWGEFGADAIGPDGVIVHSDAFPPARLHDTLGAGDTFIAGTVQALQNGETLKDSITLGCKLAGYKCGLEGFDALGDYWTNISSSE